MKAQHILLLLSLLQTLVEPEGFQEVLNNNSLQKKTRALITHTHTHIHAVAVVNLCLLLTPGISSMRKDGGQILYANFDYMPRAWDN